MITALSTNADSLSTVSIEEEKFCFEICPQKIVIGPQCQQTFSITFSPTTAAHYCYTIMSNIPSLNPDLPQMNIAIQASSSVPSFYIELPQTDISYIKASLKQDSNVKVVTFDAVGRGILYKK